MACANIHMDGWVCQGVVSNVLSVWCDSFWVVMWDELECHIFKNIAYYNQLVKLVEYHVLIVEGYHIDECWLRGLKTID